MMEFDFVEHAKIQGQVYFDLLESTQWNPFRVAKKWHLWPNFFANLLTRQHIPVMNISIAPKLPSDSEYLHASES